MTPPCRDSGPQEGKGFCALFVSSEKIHLSSGETGVTEVRLCRVSLGQILLSSALPAASGLRRMRRAVLARPLGGEGDIADDDESAAGF